jgi:hypothetical protein
MSGVESSGSMIRPATINMKGAKSSPQGKDKGRDAFLPRKAFLFISVVYKKIKIKIKK